MERLPSDLILEIFTRLPAKSVARFRTLSKHWSSMLVSPDFTKLFLTRSSTRPRLLFAVERYAYSEWQFFSTPQPQNRYDTSCHVDCHSKFSGDVSLYICSYASGLFYFPDVATSHANEPLICNPITGMYVSLAVLERYRKSRGFLGFDPIDKQFKVLFEGYPFCNQRDHHSILTLGSGELKWRINNTTAYERSWTEGICINGVLYYVGRTLYEGPSVIVCFDVRSEEFKFIEAECFIDQVGNPTASGLTLVNYKGKLGGIYCNNGNAGGRRTVELSMWVLEDVQIPQWLNYVYTLPENEVLASCECDVKVAGVTVTGDIVLFNKYTSKPFYVFYFNPERNTLQSVEIHGFGANLEAKEKEKRGEVYAFVDYVEDLSVNDAKQLKSSISEIKHLCPCCEKKEAQQKV